MLFSPSPGLAATCRSFLHAQGLPFASVLDPSTLHCFCDQFHLHFGSLFSAPITLFLWLSQVLSDSKSCVAAVARLSAFRAALDLPACSATTGGYCKARAKLPEPFLKTLALHVGSELERLAPDSWRWHKRRVLLLDGTECSMPDTPENQAHYPQSRSQQPGLGFPQIRLIVLLSFATASLVGAAMGPRRGKQTGETALFRQCSEMLQLGDVIVADRYHCTYWQLAMLPAGVDGVFRLHASRHYDFRRGNRLGKGDHIVVWNKPRRPEWMDEQTYQKIPQSLKVREVRFQVSKPGYRVREVIVATTLVDETAYSKEDMAQLYGHRWLVELDIRSIKQTLKMDILSCKTPQMVRKEMWVHLLGYNLIRKVMAQSAGECPEKVKPRELSFAGAKQTLEAFRSVLVLSEERVQEKLAREVLKAVRTHRVGNRPGRCEPRKVKRRPKPYRRLTSPRAKERARLMKRK